MLLLIPDIKLSIKYRLQLLTRCSTGRSFTRLQKSNPEQLGQVWTQHLSLIQL